MKSKSTGESDNSSTYIQYEDSGGAQPGSEVDPLSTLSETKTKEGPLAERKTIDKEKALKIAKWALLITGAIAGGLGLLAYYSVVTFIPFGWMLGLMISGAVMLLSGSAIDMAQMIKRAKTAWSNI